jgi:hypothetical protein
MTGVTKIFTSSQQGRRVTFGFATPPQRQSRLSELSLIPCIDQAEITLQTALVNNLKRSDIGLP